MAEGEADVAAALEAEVDAYVSAFTEERDEHGHRVVVRMGVGVQVIPHQMCRAFK